MYRRTQSLRAVQQWLDCSALESNVHYVGTEINAALVISEQTEI